MTHPQLFDDIEERAERAYLAAMSLRADKRMAIHPWSELSDYWRRIYRAIAQALT